MSIIRRHIAKEVLIPSAITFSVITFLILVGQLLQQLSKRFPSKWLTLGDVTMITAYLLPSLMTYTVPVALLFGTLIAFAQFSHDCEIIALKAAGIPMRKAFAPPILIGILATVLVVITVGEISPWADRQLKVLMVDMVLKEPTLVLSEQVWTREMNDMRVFVGTIDSKRMLLKDVSVVVKSEGKPERTIVAQRGRIYIDDQQKILLELKEGSIHEFDMKNPAQYSTTIFESLTIPASIKSIQGYIKGYHQLDYLKQKEMPISQILPKLTDPSTSSNERSGLLRQVSERVALAFMSLAFILIGAPLGIIPYKARRFYGVAVCAGLLITYYSFLILGETLADKRLLNPLFAVWIPNIFLGMTGVFCMVRAERS